MGLGWDWDGIGRGLGWDWDWDGIGMGLGQDWDGIQVGTPNPLVEDQKANKMKNNFFMKNLAETWFLRIKTNFLTKTGNLDIRHGF